MATNESYERRADTVAIPRPAFKFATTLAIALIVGVSGILYNLVVNHVRLSDRVDFLERFGPQSGDRFTKSDGDNLARRIDGQTRDIAKINEWVIGHEAWGKRKTGEWDIQHRNHEKRLDRLEAKEHNGVR